VSLSNSCSAFCVGVQSYPHGSKGLAPVQDGLVIPYHKLCYRGVLPRSEEVELSEGKVGRTFRVVC
jgi:hypothetical protein